MDVKKFYLGDVLSVTTGRLLSPRGMDGVYDILNFMTGDNLFTHQLPRAVDECKPHLLRQHPELDSPEFQLALGELVLMLDTESGKKQPEHLITGWLSKQFAVYGEQLEVAPIPPEAHQVRDPIEELAEMVGPEKVIVVEAPEEK